MHWMVLQSFSLLSTSAPGINLPNVGESGTSCQTTCNSLSALNLRTFSTHFTELGMSTVELKSQALVFGFLCVIYIWFLITIKNEQFLFLNLACLGQCHHHPLSSPDVTSWNRFFLVFHPITPHVQLAPKSWRLYFANAPRIHFLFSTHSTSRFIFLKHMSDDINTWLKSFNCPQLGVLGLRSPWTVHPSFCPWGFQGHITSHQEFPLLLWGQILDFSVSGLCSCLSLSPTAPLPLAN